MRLLQTGGLAALFSAAASASSFQNGTYDYIVVGGGPSGIITAERFAEAGKKVLLLERGAGPTVSTGSNNTLPWNHELTKIDVPGLSGDIESYDIWNQYMCDDTAGYAACVLGGGVSVNYMVFVHPADHDFNDKWPQGWKWDDVKMASERLYERNEGTILPSADGKRYDQGLYNILSGFFKKLGWKSADMLADPNAKHMVYSYPSWNLKNQMRAGPVRTYLPLARARDNFQLRLGPKVIRVTRSGSKVTGVEVETASGRSEIIALASGGRVVLASGALSTPRVLFNSGIGPKKQIETAVKSGVAVPPQQEWLSLPVGVGLKDHPIFDITVKTNSSSLGMLDSTSVINGSDTADISLYRKHEGVLTQGKHRLIYFTSQDFNGHTQYYQGSCAPAGKGVFSITQYMTHGLTSSGVLGLNAKGKTVIEKSPYLQTADDRKAASTFIQQLLDELTAPSTGWQLEENTNTSSIMKGVTSGMHYVGTAKMGADDGRDGGSSVVDTETKVYGIDNLYVVDGSIHPDLPTGNIMATIMVVAEQAAAKILAQQ